MEEILKDTKTCYGNDESSEKYQILGFSGKEDGYTWTDGNTASMLMYLTDAKAGEECSGKFELDGVFNDAQRVLIFVNNDRVFEDKISDKEDIDFNFTVPNSHMVVIRMELPDAVSPVDVGEGTDTSALALKVHSFTIIRKIIHL